MHLQNLQSRATVDLEPTKSSGNRAKQSFTAPRGREDKTNPSAREERGVDPPPHLKELAIGENWIPFHPIEIQKVSEDPPIFILRNFVPYDACQSLIQAAIDQGLEAAKAQDSRENGGGETHQRRIGSSVTWLAPPGEDDSTTTGTSCGKANSDSSSAGEIADILTRLAADLCLGHHDSSRESVVPENLQIVQYQPNGRFDLHHDGQDRIVTVLTYLNGVARTWFPFVGAGIEDLPTSLKDPANALKGKEPGRDGLCIVGPHDAMPTCVDDDDDDDLPKSPPRVVRIEPGDAVIFYNYEIEQDEEFNRCRRMIRWKSFHCGLPASDIKWIATNWFRLEEEPETLHVS